MTTLLLVLWQFIPFGNAQWDKNGRKPNYAQMFILRGMALVIYLCLWTKDPKDGWLVFWVSMYAIASYWVTFEILLNVYRNRPLLYFDRIEGDSGVIDRFFAKKHVLWHAGAKVAAVVIVVFSIIRIYELH